jgi:GrpB-like predicted nucleotidyltransferase (UPF0157 family)
MSAPSQSGDHVGLTEEQIRSYTVGEPIVLSGRIRIVDYDPHWPRHYQREADRLLAVLGERALRIEHIGSTSVPGLAAKPLIDMLLVVADPANEQDYVPDMEAAGYVLRIREIDWYEHRMFKGPDRDINLHVLPLGCPEIDRYLMFRERLRTNDADRELYERTKRELAGKDWKYVQNYADAKSAVVEEIIARAHDDAREPADTP